MLHRTGHSSQNTTAIDRTGRWRNSGVPAEIEPVTAEPASLFCGKDSLGWNMGRRNELIGIYASDLREKCGIEPDLGLLEKVAIGCGPAIYDPDRALVSANDPEELHVIRENFLIRKLDLRDGPELQEAIDAMLEIYGRDEPRKHRAVLYYMLARHFHRETAYL